MSKPLCLAEYFWVKFLVVVGHKSLPIVGASTDGAGILFPSAALLFGFGGLGRAACGNGWPSGIIMASPAWIFVGSVISLYSMIFWESLSCRAAILLTVSPFLTV